MWKTIDEFIKNWGYIITPVCQIICVVLLLILLIVVIFDLRITSRSTSGSSQPAASTTTVTEHSFFRVNLGHHSQPAVNATPVTEPPKPKEDGGDKEQKQLTNDQLQIVTDAFSKEAEKLLRQQQTVSSAVAVFIMELPCLIFSLMIILGILGGLRIYTVYRSTI